MFSPVWDPPSHRREVTDRLADSKLGYRPQEDAAISAGGYGGECSWEWVGLPVMALASACDVWPVRRLLEVLSQFSEFGFGGSPCRGFGVGAGGLVFVVS